MKRHRNTAAAATALVAAAALLFQARVGAAQGPDTAPPTGAVAGLRNPASGTLKLQLSASDSGWGLANAEAVLDGTTTFVRLGTGACPEHPLSGGPEPPPGDCPASVFATPISLDTRSVSDGTHRIVVRVTDAAANTATLADRDIQVDNAPHPTGTIATVTIGIANKGEEEHPGKGKDKGAEKGKGDEKGKGKGKVKGISQRLSRCRAPRLKMRLARKPLWHTRPRHVPVLRYGRRYPFKGKLTCRAPSGKRVPAAKGTPVAVYYRVWHHSFKRPHGPVKYVRVRKMKVGKKGRVKIKLGFRSGRTVLFRYYGPRRELAKAKLRLAVPPRSRRPPWGPR